jgi:adenylate cyclase
MFTDMVGYSGLAQEDEATALSLLGRHNELLRALFPKFHGREVKAVGDAFLVEFDSALDAARCALEIQRALGDHNASAPGDERIRVRIGLHVGDVVRTGGDILGDAVNIASRVEALAEPEGICLTQQVYDQVRNKIPASIVKMPPATLKNIRGPVAVYKLLPPSRPTRADSPAAEPGAGRHLAVLPLASISPDAKDEYFADGLTEELISVLSQVQDLSVIARTAVAPYKTAPKPLSEVGADLGVDSVLEGSVRKAGNRIRITLQLVDVATQSHIWASSYNREIGDVFAVQADIAERTAEALRLQLAKGGGAGPKRKSPPNVAAYDLYLRGLVAANRPKAAGLDEAVRCFEEATRLDPGFAEAYAAWANLYVAVAGDHVAMREVMPKAKELAARALELDPDCSDAHAALANAAFQFDQDWGAAEREFRAAIALNASNVTAHRFFGLMLLALQRYAEAKEELRRVIRLDPGGEARGTLSLAELFSGNVDAALRSVEEDAATGDSAFSSHPFLGLCYLAAGRREEAAREADIPPDPANEDSVFDHALLSALVGRPAEARDLLASAERGEMKSYTSLTHLAMLRSVLGETSKALDLLETAYREGDRVLWLFYPATYFAPLRKDPRFAALLDRYGLPNRRFEVPRRPRS